MVHSGAVTKDIQSIAGHADVDVLMKIYTHRNREKEHEAVGEIFEQLKRKVPLNVSIALRFICPR